MGNMMLQNLLQDKWMEVRASQKDFKWHGFSSYWLNPVYLISLLRWKGNQSPKKQPKETAESAEFWLCGALDGVVTKEASTLRESLYYDGENRGIIMNLSQVVRFPWVEILGLTVRVPRSQILTHHLHLHIQGQINLLPQLKIRIIRGTS